MFQSVASVMDSPPPALLESCEVIDAIRRRAGFLPETQLAYEPAIQTLWVTIRPELKPVFTLQLLDSLVKIQSAIVALWGAPDQYHRAPVRFLAFRGRGPFFTLGGDLDFYLDCLAKNDRAALAEYARLSAAGAVLNASGLNGLVVTLSTIHAKAIGGGIDAPRSCNVMIAEEQASFVYPEIKFNHFPITAVAILSRRMGARAAERMLMSGEEMSAQAFFEAGGLEAVVPTGTGEAWIRKYAQDSLPIHAAKTALFSAFNRRAGDLQQELDQLGQIWTDCMLRLTPSAISKLQRIAQTQDRMLARMYQRPATGGLRLAL
ncbi:enoyl-CoA hydratase-related protein [Bosea sp. (in: a-proteobacteria)]|uniref:enoyl-CoA hydratase-related protein n=1 Tax=Bosea sp. (in: a-proteobacteria) TaxID=1871050 RepID=UPI002733C048|nr:enoyl-CoA hydratase-related protein [Bosea sp. (in: a-proteobacteria)]MDP3255755.1 enoyl-CoA hydratase-related protein [Bosea sp. (in: a-proteobacteria)]